MGTWEDLQEGWNRFDGWLGSIGQTLSETYGQLGQGIMNGLMWIGSKIKDALEWIYDGLVWMGNKFKEAWDKLSEWVTCGLQWIGSGLSWVGQNIYNFGHWLYNGIVTAIRWILGGFSTVLNWIASVLSSLWNALCSLPSLFIESFNVMISSWITGIRGKFKDLFIVNTAIPAIGKGIDNLSQQPSIGGVIGLIATPFVSILIAEVLDAIIPTPHSKTIMIFPKLEIPTWTQEDIVVDLPVEPAAPEQTGLIEFPSIGYKPDLDAVSGLKIAYDVECEYLNQTMRNNALMADYSLEVT